MATIETIADILIRLTAILAVGWLAYWWASRRNPRWSVAVLRCMIVASFGLPMIYAWGPAASLAVLPAQGPQSDRVSNSSAERPLRAQVDETVAIDGDLVASAASPAADDSSGEVGDTTAHDSTGSDYIGPADVLIAAEWLQPAESGSSDSRDDEMQIESGPSRIENLDADRDRSIDGTAGNAGLAAAPIASGTSRLLRTLRRPLAVWLIFGWLVGFVVLIARLGMRLLRTRKLVGRTSEPAAALAQEFEQIAGRLGLLGRDRIRVSDDISGPCTAGWRLVTVLIPRDWQHALSDRERRVVMAHELSHAAGRDSLWDFVAQVAVSVWWFHPLAWRLASRHRLACEHRCDAVASEWAGGFADYRRMLAAWALRRHAPESTAAMLAMADRSLLLRRLRWLENPRLFGKLGRRGVAVFALVAGLLLGSMATVRLEPRVAAEEAAAKANGERPLAEDDARPVDVDTQVQKDAPETKNDDQKPTRNTGIGRPNVPDIDRSQTRPKIVRVVDEHDQPVAGAEVRVGSWEDEDGDSVGATGINPITNKAGEVTIRVPQGATRAQISASAEGYAATGTQYSQYSLSGEPTLKLSKGQIVRVYAIDAQGEPLPEAVPILENCRKWPREFQPVPERPGYFESPAVTLDRQWMRVVDGSGEGPILFSELIDVTAPENTDDEGKIVTRLEPGIRLEGRLDDSVPRPIENGIVELYINEGAEHQLVTPSAWTWEDTAKVNDDGSFVFESLPAGGHAQLVALVDGYQSTKPTAEVLRAYLQKHNATDAEVMNRAEKRNAVYWPHLFALPQDKKKMNVELPCTPTSAVDVKVIDPIGQPIEGATVSFNPNGYFLGGELFIPGTRFFSTANMVRPRPQEMNAAMRAWAESFLRVKTGDDGIAQVHNLPADERESYKVEAEGYVMPVHPTSSNDRQERYAAVDLIGGETLRRTLTMEKFVPRTSREIAIVDRQGKPAPKITVTVTEVAFDDSPNDWELWAVQRFGPLATGETGDDGIVRLDVPLEVENRKVAEVRIAVSGKLGDDAYVQRERLEIPPRDDGRIVVLTVSEEAPREQGRYRDVSAGYVDPAEVLDRPSQKLLEKLVESPSLVVLKQLLRASNFDAVTPLAFCPERNLLPFNTPENDRPPVEVLETEHGRRVVVLCDVRPKDAEWEVKPERRFPPEAAFVFDPADGALIAMLGGWASAGGHYCNVMLTNLGGTDDYFLEASAFEEHEPFKYLQMWHRLGREEEPALVTHGYANATAWNGEDGPSQPPAEFGYTMYHFNGRNIEYDLPGVAPSGAIVPRKVYWDGLRNRFIGPVTQSYEGEPLYRVIVEQSAEFEPLDVEPGDMVAAGGRRDYKNWHGWDVVIPKGKSGKLRMLLVDESADGAADEELAQSELKAGPHDLQLHFADAVGSEDQSDVEIRVDPDDVDRQARLLAPRVPVNASPSVPGQPVARTAKESADLLRRPTVKEGVWLVWRVTLE